MNFLLVGSRWTESIRLLKMQKISESFGKSKSKRRSKRKKKKIMRTLKISQDTFELIKRLKLDGESSNDIIWRALNFYIAKLERKTMSGTKHIPIMVTLQIFL